MAFVLLQHVGQQRLVAQPQVVEQRDARDPVPVLHLALSLQVVLPTAEIPHEVTPVHEVALIGEEESQVLPLRRHLHHHLLTSVVVGHHAPADATHPALVGIGLLRVPHAGEQHVLGVDHAVLRLGYVVGVALVGMLGALRPTIVDGRALLHLHLQHLRTGHGFPLWLRRVGLPVEERSLSVLVARQIGGKREDVLGRVLVHRRVGSRAYQDDGIAAVADDEHEQAQQDGVEDGA